MNACLELMQFGMGNTLLSFRDQHYECGGSCANDPIVKAHIDIDIDDGGNFSKSTSSDDSGDQSEPKEMMTVSSCIMDTAL